MGTGMEELPARPHIPPAAAGAVGAAVTAAVLLETAWRGYAACGYAAVSTGALVACAVALLLLLAVRSVVGRRVGCESASVYFVWAAAGVALAMFSSSLWVRGWEAGRASLFGASASSLTFETVGDPSLNAYGAAMTAAAHGEEGNELAQVRLSMGEPVDAGRALACIGTLSPLDGSDWARSRFMKGEVGSVKVIRVLEDHGSGRFDPIGEVRAAALRAIDPKRSEARALVAGIVCGRTTELNAASASDAFSRTGLTHLVAVSGSHLALIGMLLKSALARTRCPRWCRAAVLVSVMGAYVVFTGCAPSALRSVAMVGFSLLAGLGFRRAHPISGLSLAVFGLILLDPGTVYDIGFQLSAASVLFILLFCRYLEYLLLRLRMPGILAAPLSLTLCAQWATLPITLPIFGELSLAAPVANLVTGPLMTGLLMVGLLVVFPCTLVPGLAPLLVVPECVANASIFVAELFAGVPWASIPVTIDPVAACVPYAAACAVWVLWRDWSGRQLATVLCAVSVMVCAHVMRWALFTPAAITVLDVGQADSILIRDGRSSVLVDAGVDEAVVDALARNNVMRLDAVVITHWDRDHWVGLPDLLEKVPVDRIIVADGAAVSVPEALRRDVEDGVVEMAHGDVFRVGGFACTAVWPDDEVAGMENAESLCLLVEYEGGEGRLATLLTGDTEADDAARYADEVGDIDVLKVGHHGSKASVDERMIAELRPEFAIASAGEGNAYGHPTRECIELLDEHDVAFACTKDVGDVSIYPDADGARVRTARRGGVE